MINPKLQYCPCGNTFQPKTHHKLIMLIKDDYTWTCPQCGAKLKFRLINHVVKLDTVVIKNKKKIWRKG